MVYDATVLFCDRFVDKRSRTHDQMVQAARSGVQNIAEGSMASATSKRTELKLTGVARASLEELLLDFEDFLRQRGLKLWSKDDPRALAVRRRYQSDRSDLSDREAQAQARKRKQRPRIRCLSLGLSLGKQPPLLHRQMQQLEQAFLAEGGFTERLYRERRARRQNQ